MKFLKLILQTIILNINDSDQILKNFQILYYRNIGFFDIKFFKLILQTIILNINDSDQILKIFQILYYIFEYEIF